MCGLEGPWLGEWEILGEWSGQGPASSLSCPTILISEFWSTRNESPITLPRDGGQLPPASQEVRFPHCSPLKAAPFLTIHFTYFSCLLSIIFFLGGSPWLWVLFARSSWTANIAHSECHWKPPLSGLPSFPDLNLPAVVTASVTRLSQVWPVTANLPPSPLPQTKFNLSSSFILVQESTFSIDGQIENVLGFVGHRNFVEMNQLCHYSMEAAIDRT